MSNFYEESVKTLGQLFGGTPASERLRQQQARARSDQRTATFARLAGEETDKKIAAQFPLNRSSAVTKSKVTNITTTPTNAISPKSEFSKTFTPEYFAKLAAEESARVDASSPNEENTASTKNKPVVDTKKLFSIDNFRTELNNYGVLPSHSFLVRFAPFAGASELNSALNNYTIINKDKLIMRCDNALLPATTLIKEEAIRRYGYGPTETVPYNVNFGDFTLQWIVDSNSEVIDFFNKWINVIVNHDSKGGADMLTQKYGYNPYEAGYKDDYSNSQVSVFVYDRQLNTTIQYSIYDVFPISIQSINLAWGDENQMVKYNVTFAFTDMVMETPKAGDNALFLAAQQEAAAKKAASKSPNEEIIVTGIRGNRQNETAPYFGSPPITGQYTLDVPPDVQQNINNVAAGKKDPKTINIVTVPLTMT